MHNFVAILTDDTLGFDYQVGRGKSMWRKYAYMMYFNFAQFSSASQGFRVFK